MIALLLVCSIACSVSCIRIGSMPIHIGNDIPPPNEVAKVARYIVHKVNWTVISHVSHDPKSEGFPHGRVFSMSDGPVSGGSGTPYIYTTFLDRVAVDLKVDSKCGMTMSLAQTDYCTKKNLDPENPLCAQVMLTGNFEFLKNTSSEWNLAKEALFSRHPEMMTWPEWHGFLFGKLNIVNIQILDFFGGSKFITPEEYYNAY